MKHIVYFLIMMVVLTGCRTTTMTDCQKEYIHDTISVIQNKVDSFQVTKYDSIYIKDSVYVEKEAHGDTIIIRVNNYSTKYVKSLENALKVANKDSIVYKDKIIYKDVIKYLTVKESFWSSLKTKINYLIYGAILCVVVGVIIRFRKTIWNIIGEILHI